MTRWLVVFLVLAMLLTLTREAVLTLGEMRMRRRAQARFGGELDGRALEHDIEAWRRDTGRRLWIRLVGIPLLLLGILILVGVYG